jgi:phosphoribulokinase
MSPRHPIIAIRGSSGAGTTTVTTTFQQIFRREGVKAVIVYGDAFHRYDLDDMRTKMAEMESNFEFGLGHGCSTPLAERSDAGPVPRCRQGLATGGR